MMLYYGTRPTLAKWFPMVPNESEDLEHVGEGPGAPSTRKMIALHKVPWFYDFIK